MSLKYRPDIDGLRSLAVMPVILFHAGASWLPGGFVGVDIFFVISGYLVSLIILREIQAGGFSFLRFYERRLRRIVPALLVMLLVTVVVFQVIALPDQAQGAAESGIAALLSVSNFYFWSQSGYFAPAAESLPLLHTWSLGVEEQFYLLFPVAIVLLWKLKLPMKWVLALGTCGLFLFSVWVSSAKPSVAYYWLPSRAWELALGAVIAAGVFPAVRSPILREGLPVLGVGMIVFALLWIRGDMVFPGWVALLPCIGAGLVIHAGGRSWVAQTVLGAAPMVFVGLLSYSLYLWHWPVLVSLRIYLAQPHLDAATATGAIAATFVIAWLSWRFVEKPFRGRNALSGRAMAVSLGLGASALAGVSIVSINSHGFPGRLAEPARIALAAASDIDPLQHTCESFEQVVRCRFGDPDAPVRLAVIGDSHAAAIRPAIEASGLLAGAAGTISWMNSCPLFDGAYLRTDERRQRCEAFKAEVWQELQLNDEIDTVVLAGRWPYYVTGFMLEAGQLSRTDLMDAYEEHPQTGQSEQVFRRSVGRTLERLNEMGIDVVLIGGSPEPGFDVPRTVALARQNGWEAPSGVPRSLVESRAGYADDVLADLVAGRAGVRLIPIWQAFCDTTQCRIEDAGVPIYSDDDHLSFTGSTNLAGNAIANYLR